MADRDPTKQSSLPSQNKIQKASTPNNAASTARVLPRTNPKMDSSATWSATASLAAPTPTTCQATTPSATPEEGKKSAAAALKNTAEPVAALTPLSSPLIESTLAKIEPMLQNRQAALQDIQDDVIYPLPEEYANDVLFVAATNDDDEIKLLSDQAKFMKPRHVRLYLSHSDDFPFRMPVPSGAAVQPYELAGALSAHKDIVTAVEVLFRRDNYRVYLRKLQVGTVIVGAVENFVVRPGRGENKGDKPIDYGMVVFCKVPLTAVPGSEDKHDHPKVKGSKWVWHRAVSRGVPFPVKFWKEAESYGFNDPPPKNGMPHIVGKVAIGARIREHTGIDKTDWHRVVAGVSRYELLKEAIKKGGIPWPDAPKRSH
ncbi:hypothetical protein VTK56DRAFT_1681 [Thermocarpiscus australiensis]